MNTKLGEPVPPDLATALIFSAGMIDMWDKLRPSCQRRYVALVTSAKRAETRERRVQSVLRMTADYYRRHRQPRLS